MNAEAIVEMKVRIIREPAGATVEASLNYYRTGEVYDIPANLAEYLVMEEFAIFEMRDRDRPATAVPVERRARN